MYIQTANLIIVSAVMPVVASVAVCIRAVARLARKSESNSLIASDYLVFASLFFCFAISVAAICGAAIDRVGTPPVEQLPGEFTGYLKMMFAIQFLYISAVGLIKLSVLAFYRSIFTTRNFRVMCDIVTAVVTAWILAMLLGTLLRSQPISVNWNPKQHGGRHGNIVVLFSFVGASDIFLDILILTMPWPMIARLQMTPAKKLTVAGIFLLGGFCVISSTVRLAYVIKFVSQYNGLGSYYSELVVQNLIWMIVEPSASVIAACLPTLGPLFKGGRAPSSMIRSVRSILSIRSKLSSNNSTDSRKSSQESSTHRVGHQPSSAFDDSRHDYRADVIAHPKNSAMIGDQLLASDGIIVNNTADVTRTDMI